MQTVHLLTCCLSLVFSVHHIRCRIWKYSKQNNNKLQLSFRSIGRFLFLLYILLVDLLFLLFVFRFISFVYCVFAELIVLSLFVLNFFVSQKIGFLQIERAFITCLRYIDSRLFSVRWAHTFISIIPYLHSLAHCTIFEAHIEIFSGIQRNEQRKIASNLRSIQ